MSGRTPSCSHANVVPVRPRPDWISSAMSSTPRSVQSSRARAQVAVGRDDHAGLALDRLDEERHRVVVDRGLERVRVAVRDDLEPRRERPEAVLDASSVEKLTIVIVRPWKLPLQTITFARSGVTPFTS